MAGLDSLPWQYPILKPHPILKPRSGAADYELWLECDSFAGLGEALTQICGFPGVAVESTSLVLHEVTGLRLRRPAVADGVTKRRLSSM